MAKLVKAPIDKSDKHSQASDVTEEDSREEERPQRRHEEVIYAFHQIHQIPVFGAHKLVYPNSGHNSTSARYTGEYSRQG